MGCCCRLVELKNKEVICICDGTRLGCVNDVEIDVKSAKVVAIIVFGRLKCFGLFGRHDDIIIRWDDIEIIGEDTILVKFKPKCRPNKRGKFFRKFYAKS